VSDGQVGQLIGATSDTENVARKAYGFRRVARKVANHSPKRGHGCPNIIQLNQEKPAQSRFGSMTPLFWDPGLSSNSDFARAARKRILMNLRAKTHRTGQLELLPYEIGRKFGRRFFGSPSTFICRALG
jgi:hypothetical protein